MVAIKEWLAQSPYASWFQAFVAIVISMAIAHWTIDKVIDFDEWQVWVIAALVATLKPLVVAINPADPRWGKDKDAVDEETP
jgi:hypothetical protein